MPEPQQSDVLVLGGGLAGLTLALQLRQRLPEATITVIERQRHPVPVATHKVGESSVEIAAHYFDTILGLREHLASRQLKKFGFRFFFSDGRCDIDAVTELGASRFLSTPSYQIDRGIFENFLGARARESRIDFLDGCKVLDFQIASEERDHRVTIERDGVPRLLRGRWLLDASGRSGLLKRRLGLGASSPHDANAVWFRVGARIDIDGWSDDADWRHRCNPPSRWLSTNHLVGRGYWVWLIPLSSGSHSVGIVADAKTHPISQMNTFERAMRWLHHHQPRLATDLEGKRDCVQDFAYFRRFSYDCRKLFCGDRWAITGEAGVFLDPFYSPGSDFIAIGNTYITDLVARDLAGEPVAARASIYEQFFRSFYESTLTLYVGQYDLFGDPRVLPLKVLWDYAYYWGVLCQIFFQRRLTDLAALSRLRAELLAARDLNRAMQDLFRRWGQCGPGRNPIGFLDQAALDWFAELNRGLTDQLDQQGFHQRMVETTWQLHELAHEIASDCRREFPFVDLADVDSLLARPRNAASCARDAIPPALFG